MQLIRELEITAFHAWCAKEIEQLGGWYLRADGDVTRRANSVLPFDDPSLDLDRAIEYVVHFYLSRHITPRFQVTRASMPLGLDDTLAEFGFIRELVVAVETADIESLTSLEPSWPVDITADATDDWFHAYQWATGYSDRKVAIRRGIMSRTTRTKAFASVRADGIIASVGFGVVDGPWLGIFSLVTHKDHRRMGMASAINHALAVWGQKNGANKCYLQVEVDNPPALQLYHRLGFIEVYQYWYRQVEQSDDRAHSQ